MQIGIVTEWLSKCILQCPRFRLQCPPLDQMSSYRALVVTSKYNALLNELPSCPSNEQTGQQNEAHLKYITYGSNDQYKHLGFPNGHVHFNL